MIKKTKKLKGVRLFFQSEYTTMMPQKGHKACDKMTFFNLKGSKYWKCSANGFTTAILTTGQILNPEHIKDTRG